MQKILPVYLGDTQGGPGVGTSATVGDSESPRELGLPLLLGITKAPGVGTSATVGDSESPGERLLP